MSKYSDLRELSLYLDRTTSTYFTLAVPSSRFIIPSCKVLACPPAINGSGVFSESEQKIPSYYSIAFGASVIMVPVPKMGVKISKHISVSSEKSKRQAIISSKFNTTT
jgi:hypothetical protein